MMRGVYERSDWQGKGWYIRYADASGKIRRERVTWEKLAEAEIKVGKHGETEQPGQILAQKLRDSRIAKKNKGEVIELIRERKVRFSELCDDADAYVRSHNRGWKVDVLRIAILKKQFGDCAADAISIAALRKWFDSQTWSAGSANRYKAALSLIYRLALENGKAKENPAKKLKHRQETNSRLRWLSAPEEVTLRAAIEKKFAWRWHLPEFEIAVNTGMRPSEMFELRWHDIDFERRQISLLKTKTGKPRHIPINTACLWALKQLRERPLSKGFVFGHEDGSQVIGHRWFEEAAKEAGLDICWYEATRHTFASRLVMAGVDLRTVADLMGHSTIQMTMRYAHLAPQHQLEAVERLGIPTSTRTDTQQNYAQKQETTTTQ